MDKWIERLAHLIGWKTLYHVAWTEPVSSGNYTSGDMTITASPWITSDNWRIVREVVASYNGLKPNGFTIVSVTRL